MSIFSEFYKSAYLHFYDYSIIVKFLIENNNTENQSVIFFAQIFN